jgi:hypothetical protein
MPIPRYFVERLTAHSDVWMVKFDDEEHGPLHESLIGV